MKKQAEMASTLFQKWFEGVNGAYVILGTTLFLALYGLFSLVDDITPFRQAKVITIVNEASEEAKIARAQLRSWEKYVMTLDRPIAPDGSNRPIAPSK